MRQRRGPAGPRPSPSPEAAPSPLAPATAPREAGAADASALSLERAQRLGHRPAPFLPGTPPAPPDAPPVSPAPVAPLLAAEGRPSLQPKGLPLSGDLTALGPDFPRQDPAWIGRAVSPSPSGVIARAAMDKILAGQKEREGAIVAGTDKATGIGPGTYTTVGFEWDVAQLAEHSKEKPNYLQGLSHLELAESDLRQHALAYLFETDAGNILELVTPPFLVRTRAARDAMPVLADIQAIVDAMAADLGTLLATAKSVGDLVDASWAPFGIGRWLPKDFVAKLDWRNWSHRAGADAKDGLAKHGFREIAIAKSFPHGKLPQVNIAGTEQTFEKIEDKKGSRSPEKVEEVVDLEFKLQKLILSRALEADTPRDVRQRLEVFLRHVGRVLAQQSAVPAIRQLAKLQQTGFAGKEEVTGDQMKGPANQASFVKDATNVWLKADLVTYGLSFLEPVDWAALGAILPRISQRLGGWKDFLTERQEAAGVKSLMQEMLVNLATQANLLAAASTAKEKEAVKKDHAAKDGKDGKKEADPFAAQVTAVLEALAAKRTGLNEHNPKILGVRQDTFIAPTHLRALAKELGLGKILHVMEVRNASGLLEEPGAKDAKKGGAAAKGGAAKGAAAAGKDNKVAAEGDDKGAGKKDEKAPPELLEIAEKAYDLVIALARRQGGAPQKVPGELGQFRAGNPLTQQQEADLAETKSRLVPTHQDGDCAINAVFDSRGTIASARVYRHKIAKQGLADGVITREQAETILQPGDWSLSHIMLPILAGILEIRIVIVQGDGRLISVGQPTRGFVRIFHVDGPKPHYYGSRP